MNVCRCSLLENILTYYFHGERAELVGYRTYFVHHLCDVLVLVQQNLSDYVLPRQHVLPQVNVRDVSDALEGARYLIGDAATSVARSPRNRTSELRGSDRLEKYYKLKIAASLLAVTRGINAFPARRLATRLGFVRASSHLKRTLPEAVEDVKASGVGSCFLADLLTFTNNWFFEGRDTTGIEISLG